MNRLALRGIHDESGAVFSEVKGEEVAAHYGDAGAEYRRLRETAGVVDFGFRGRVCVLGGDRKRFLHGQVTNDVNRLKSGEGCYAALVTAKGRMQSDLNIYCLKDELLLDFEPGLTAAVMERLQKYVIADDVEIVDASPHYGMFGVEGPLAAEVCRRAGFAPPEPCREWTVSQFSTPERGEVYLAQRARYGEPGYDLFVPVAAGAEVWRALAGAAGGLGGGPCGWEALEAVRIEAGIPRFGLDMDETNLPPEAGLEESAISYAKGCYIGQEIIARIRTYGQVAKRLRGLDFEGGLSAAPERGAKLSFQGKEAGWLTSSVFSPGLGRWIGLGYVRREADREGGTVELAAAGGSVQARVVHPPYVKK